MLKHACVCNTVRVHYSRWRYARGCLANRQYTLKGKKKEKTLRHQPGYICLCSLRRCRAHPWTVESTLLLYCHFYSETPTRSTVSPALCRVQSCLLWIKHDGRILCWHSCFHTPCGLCPGPHEACPTPPFQVGPGTVPKQGIFVFTLIK